MTVLEKLAEIKMIDVWIPTVDHRWLILPRFTQPDSDAKLLIDKLKLELPSQPPPRITASKEVAEIDEQPLGKASLWWRPLKTTTDSTALSRIRSIQLRKLG